VTVFRRKEKPFSTPKERVQMPGGFRSRVLTRGEGGRAAWHQGPQTQSGTGFQTPVSVYLWALLNLSLRNVALPSGHQGAGELVWSGLHQWGEETEDHVFYSVHCSIRSLRTLYEVTLTHLVLHRSQDDFWTLCNHASQFA